MRTFRIKNEYAEESEIVCRENALEELTCRNDPETFVFTDSNVLRLYGAYLKETFPNAHIHAMTAGEENKTAQTLLTLLEAMAQAGLHRTGRLVCVGGGVVGDLGGLASALYMRGIACIQVPTTLLAQVDSSVGGKTAVDFAGVKNLIGAIKQPERVLVDPAFLKTLSARELRCGLGEIVKHAALNGALFDRLIAHSGSLLDLEFLAELVPENIAVKADVVTKDPHEQGLRKCLNLGHTTAHAFELYDGKLSHGEYVLLGIIFEAELAKTRTACDEGYLNELKALCVKALGGIPKLPAAAEVTRFAMLDKKNETGKEVVVTAPVKKGEYALLRIPYFEYAEELARIQEALC